MIDGNRWDDCEGSQEFIRPIASNPTEQNRTVFIYTATNARTASIAITATNAITERREEA